MVTVLFCDLVGSTGRAEEMDPEDVRALLSRYHERVRAELERFGGTVEKFIGDAVMALFGARVAHEDDPERAVRAAKTPALEPTPAGPSKRRGGARPTGARPRADAFRRWVAGDVRGAADVFASAGAHATEAFVRLRAAEQLVAQGRRAEAGAELQRCGRLLPLRRRHTPHPRSGVAACGDSVTPPRSS